MSKTYEKCSKKISEKYPFDRKCKNSVANISFFFALSSSDTLLSSFRQNWNFRKTLKKRGFTLIELLIAGSIFAMVALISVNIFINVSRSYRRITLENEIYSESYLLMEKLSREVRKGTIDYEEYHNQTVLKSSDYGENYSEYAKKFFHPGFKEENSTPKQIDVFGGVCANDRDKKYPDDCPGEAIYTPSLDQNTGKNPFEGSSLISGVTEGSDQATALCDNNFNKALDTSVPLNRNCNIDGNATSSEATDFEMLHFQKELYLVNSAGDQKTIMAREVVNDPDGSLRAASPSASGDEEYALSLVRLDGTDDDQNGVKEKWQCTADFICTKTVSSIKKPDKNDLVMTNSNQSCPGGAASCDEVTNGEDFVPLTPSSMNIISVKFLIAPLEDPHKAFGEDDATGDYIFMQPYVTIVLTVRPSVDAAKKIFGDPKNFPTITLQTTVSSRVYNEIKSYGD
ncbi:prepilin-type N-terminal cleavage/methylation domain-containing protein [Candidatus Peregrinibacteria bacterium]|nr:prepilin-type N-terminal cleavage/methylation domain-containing protein [Candidatus Peregrinibacteria bacterium]